MSINLVINKINYFLIQSGLFFLLVLSVSAAEPYNDTTANAWCTSTLHALLNDTNSGYLSLFTPTEQSYFLETECGGNAKITLLSQAEWDDTTLLAGVSGESRTTKNWYRWGVNNGSDSGNYAPTGVNAFWTKTPMGANTNAYVVNATTGLTSSANVTNGDDYEIIPAVAFDATNACAFNGTYTKDGSHSKPYDMASGYCVLTLDQDSLALSDVDIAEEVPEIIVAKNGTLTLSGKVYDHYASKTITIEATIGGVKKTTTVATPALGASWELTWTWNEMSEMTHNPKTITFNFTDGTKSGSLDYLGKIIIDKTDPICGSTWDPKADDLEWKEKEAKQKFTLVSPSDTGGAGLATPSADPSLTPEEIQTLWEEMFSCETGAKNGNTCPVNIYDRAGNSAVCTSPANKVDDIKPILNVTPAIQGWQVTKQDIFINASDAQTGIERIAYSWIVNNLGTKCDSGNATFSGTNLKYTIMGGENTLYVCTVDKAGNVSTFSDIYSYTPPKFQKPHLEKQVTPANLYWNILHVADNQSYIEIKGYFPPSIGTYHYQLDYMIPTTNKTYTQALTTSPHFATHFSFFIPTADFSPSITNHTFIGPQKLKITDLDELEATTIDHNLSFFFPIYQISHQRNMNYYIMSSDNRLNELE